MDQVPAQFAHSLATLTKVGDTLVAFQISSLVYTARNDLAKKAVACGADFVLWIDSDMVFSPDLLQRLMEHMKNPEIDMVSGLYFRRVAPYTPVLYDKLEITEERCEHTEFDQIPVKPFEVGGCGFGGVLMRTSLIYDVALKFGDMFAPIKGVGEDLSFCWRARQLGHKVICDPSITLGHVGHTIITREFSEKFRGIN
jgi:GT2 family glycosyltransferase